VLIGLFLVFGGAGHYGALILGWKRQREFVDRYIRQARRAAWGDELGVRGIPGIDSVAATAPIPDASEGGAVAMTRRQKRMMDKESRKENRKGSRATPRASGTSTPTEPVTGSVGERKRVVAENGKVLIVDSIGNVFLEEESEEGEKQEFLLDLDEIQRPSIRDTMVFNLPIWCFKRTVGRVLGSDAPEDDEQEVEPEVNEASETTATSNSGSSRRRTKRSQRS